MSSSAQIRIMLLTCASAIGCLPQIAVRAQAVAPADTVATSLRLLDAVYRDLRHGATNLELGGLVYPSGSWLREFGVQISDSGPSMRVLSNREDLSAVYFHGSFRFDDTGLRSYEAVGRFLKYRENAELAQLVSLNVDWPNTEVVAALQRAGAAFGPDRDAMKAEIEMLARNLAPIIGGPPLTATAVSFRYSTPQERSTGLGVGSIGWQAVFVPASDDVRFDYLAVYEPFAGRLRFLRRRDRPI